MAVETQTALRRANYESKLIEAVGRVKGAELKSNEVIDGKHTFIVAIGEKELIIEIWVTEAKVFGRTETTYHIHKRVNGEQINEKLIGLGVTNFTKLFRYVAKGEK